MVKKFEGLAFTIVFTLIFAVQAVAQNAVDSDLSNRAGSDKNFLAWGWFFGCVALLVFVVLIAYRRKRKHLSLRRDSDYLRDTP